MVVYVTWEMLLADSNHKVGHHCAIYHLVRESGQADLSGGSLLLLDFTLNRGKTSSKTSCVRHKCHNLLALEVIEFVNTQIRAENIYLDYCIHGITLAQIWRLSAGGNILQRFTREMTAAS